MDKDLKKNTRKRINYDILLKIECIGAEMSRVQIQNCLYIVS